MLYTYVPLFYQMKRVLVPLRESALLPAQRPRVSFPHQSALSTTYTT